MGYKLLVENILKVSAVMLDHLMLSLLKRLASKTGKWIAGLTSIMGFVSGDNKSDAFILDFDPISWIQISTQEANFTCPGWCIIVLEHNIVSHNKMHNL